MVGFNMGMVLHTEVLRETLGPLKNIFFATLPPCLYLILFCYFSCFVKETVQNFEKRKQSENK